MIPAWLRTVNRDITNLYQGLSMWIVGPDMIELRYGVWWG